MDELDLPTPGSLALLNSHELWTCARDIIHCLFPGVESVGVPLRVLRVEDHEKDVNFRGALADLHKVEVKSSYPKS